MLINHPGLKGIKHFGMGLVPFDSCFGALSLLKKYVSTKVVTCKCPPN